MFWKNDFTEAAELCRLVLSDRLYVNAGPSLYPLS